MIDRTITNVELPDAPSAWYSDELHVAPQYMSHIKSTNHVKTIR